MTASLTGGESYGAVIGSDSNQELSSAINIGGSVTITATTSGYGAGIGSGGNGTVGAITIGGSANVTASSTQGAGIGAGNIGTVSAITIGGTANVTASSDGGAGISSGTGGEAGTVSCGTGTTVTVTSYNSETGDTTEKTIGDDEKDSTVTVAELAAKKNPGAVYAWTELTGGASTYQQRNKTAGYVVENNTIKYETAGVDPLTLFTLSGIKDIEGITIGDDGIVTLTEDNLDGNVTLEGEGYTLALASGIAAPTKVAATFDGFVYKSEYVSAAGYEVSEDGKSIEYKAVSEPSPLFTLSGVENTAGITVDENNVVTINASNLDGNPTAGSKVVELTNEVEGGNYTLALASDVQKQETPSGEPNMIPSTSDAFTISEDGVYKFETGFSGALTISARNVKLIGAGEQLTDVSIDLSGVSNANLWIENLDITSREEKNLIKFGSGTNYLTVKGTSTLVNTKSGTEDSVFEKALINVGGGLNILGDGTLTASLTGSASFGAVIGSDYQENSSADINIGGSVTITTESTSAEGLGLGAGIGSGGEGEIGTITIGGKANVTAKANGGAGIGSGFYGNVDAITIGGNAIVNASSNGGAGIGSGTYGSVDAITIGGSATVTGTSKQNNGIGSDSDDESPITPVYGTGTNVTNIRGNTQAEIEKTEITDTTSALDEQSEPTNPAYAWTELTEGGASTYGQHTKTEGYVVDEGSKSISYQTDKYAELFTLSGIASTNGITVDENNVVTLNASNLDPTKTVSIGDGDYTLALADGVDAAQTTAAAFDGLVYKSEYVSTAGYKVSSDAKSIEYKAVETPSTLFTLTGVANTTGITISGTTVTINASNLNNANVSISEGNYTLALADGISAPQTTAAHFDGLTYKSVSNTAGYTLASGAKSIEYTAAVAASDLFTLTGVANTTGITISGTTVTLNASNLNNANVSISGGNYTLALASGISASQTTDAHFDGLTYKSVSNTAGYTLASDAKSIEYTAAVEASELFTLDGAVITDDITIDTDTKVVTLTAANLNETDVTISGDYTLALTDDIPHPVEIVRGLITSGTTTINKDGAYKFNKNFSGTVNIGAQNVKLIGADSQLSNVLINVIAANANLWIENLNITSSESDNIIKFGSGTNTLTVAGENTLVNTGNSVGKAVINVGGGPDIIGDGTLTAQLTNGLTAGAAIGSDDGKSLPTSNINIGGSAKVTASSNYGAGIGSGRNSSIGAITIGGEVVVTASSDKGEGIGIGLAGTVGSVSYGTGATVNGENGTVENVAADSLTAQLDPAGDIEVDYKWSSTIDTDGKASYQQLSKTAGYVLDDGAKSISYQGKQYSDLFTLDGITSTEGITIDEDGVVTIANANLPTAPIVGETKVTITDAGNGIYTLAPADDIPQSEPVNGDPITLEKGITTIEEDGVYQFAEGWTGTLTISAQNVKLIGADSQLSNVSIDLSAVENANLWLEDLDITSNEKTSIIRFGAGTNTLTVAGTNSLVDFQVEHRQALINIGGGLNIIGDGELTASLTGWSYGAVIGSDPAEDLNSSNINIGGSVKITATSNGTGAVIGSGAFVNFYSSVGAITIGGNANVTASSTDSAGIGTSSGGSSNEVGNITIGGNATVTASSTNCEGIGKGAPNSTVGTIKYGTDTTISVTSGSESVTITKEDVTVAEIAAKDMPRSPAYEWTPVTEGASTYRHHASTEGYNVAADRKSITYDAEGYIGLFKLEGITSTSGIIVNSETGVVTLAKANLPTDTTKLPVTLTDLVEDGDYKLAVANDVPQYEPGGAPIRLTVETKEITADGVYKFAAGYTGTLEIKAQNVKLIGADGTGESSPLTNVSIDLSAVEGANL